MTSLKQQREQCRALIEQARALHDCIETLPPSPGQNAVVSALNQYIARLITTIERLEGALH
jgi:hypothetical protein